MRLTQLEIKGFKSFADKTVVNFDNDITGVVGPNGCGKSNVVDAIRWVLGEQRAKTLRLEKMENIIFNGTKDRKAGNVAEVSLTFDNTKNIIPTEFANVTITRTLYRNGDSGYQINGVTCRLKDIKDLFLDTGIGSSTYAIMELKMIDDILNDVDNSRRILIEQAAGISKYKQRKKETLNKLNATEADLNRVQDLLFEIESNMKSLEAQARKALRYKKLKEQYKELSVDLAKYDIISINEQYEALEQKKSELTDNKTKAEAELGKLEAALQQMKTNILEREKSLSGQQKELNDFINSIQERESDKKVSQQKMEFLTSRMEVLDRELVSLQNEEKTLNSDLAELEKNISQEEESIKTYKSEVDTAKELLDEKRAANLRMKEKLEEQQAQHYAYRNQLNESEKQLAIRDSRLESLKNTIQRSLFEKEERLEDLKLLEKSITEKDGKVKKQQELIVGLEIKEKEGMASMEKLEVKIEESRNALLQSRRDMDAKSNEFRLTKNMVDNLEGFPESIKFLKQKADWLENAPLLSDVIYCEEKYRVPFELALKPYMNHFIVSTESEASNAIELLSSSAKGRANFFVLEQFKQLGKINRSGKAPAGCVAAIDVVEAQKEHESLLQFLLKDIYIAEDVKAGSYPKIEADTALLVDVHGNWIKSSVELSGGAVGLFEGKRLGRAKNLEKLEKAIEKLAVKVKEAEGSLKTDQSKLQELKNNSFRKTIERERDELQKIEREMVSHESRRENFLEFVDNQSKHTTEIEGNINAIQAEVDVLKKQFESASKDSELHSHKLDSTENEFKAASMEFSHLQEKFNERNILYIQRENALQSYRQSRQYKMSRLNDVVNELGKNREELTFSKDEIQAINKSLASLDEDLIALYKDRDERKEALSIRESDYYQLKEKAQEEEDAIRQRSKAKEDTEMNIQQVKEKRNTLKFELHSLRQRLALEFKLDVEAMLETLEKPEVDRVDIELRIEKVARKIDNFGDVNPMAEAAYEEMRKRFDFITEQKDDLVDAKQTLLDTIDEIEATATTQFMESFTAIRENFIDVFRSMFSEEDKCDLILLDPANPLESKVDIIAKPKGKRPQSINQLSGGEKSLTSLSLLFALYLYKPAPFCILDEVDAPLDDANVVKFNKAIRQFAKDSQFIVVTHNKSTMTAVDVAYGVTMHKPGQSMLVPADFRDYKDVEEAAFVA